MNNFVYYTRSLQEQMALFSWLLKRGYKEANSSLGYLSTTNKTVITNYFKYDFLCVDINNKEFGFFTGKFQNVAHVIVYTTSCVHEMMKEIKHEETSNSPFNFSISTTSTP